MAKRHKKKAQGGKPKASAATPQGHSQSNRKVRSSRAQVGTPKAPSRSSEETGEEAALAPSKFLVVGIGASAGGLEALGEMLAHVPVDHMAFVVVQHLDPHHESLLTPLLARTSKVQVITAVDGMALEKNHVYVIPPNADLAVMHGVIRLIQPATPGPRLPIDYFFRSLADDQGPAAIGIVLSGTGSDGTFGLKAIKAAGGITFAQDPTSAKYDGMPRSALAGGNADFSLTPKEIGEELTRIALQPRAPRVSRSPTRTTQHEDQLAKLFVLIRAAFGVDLSQYKLATVERRIDRRMTVHKLNRLEDYVRFVQSNREELQELYQDTLITVTNFFRDPETFALLGGRVLPQIIAAKASNAPLRVWVPACATGEEAYSIAICLLEACEERHREPSIQIFGTDIDDQAIKHARRGIYPMNIAADVSPDRLNRFFVKNDGEYQISRRIRDMVVFSTQNILKDAPFSRMDLASCRNLLIYLQPASQRKVLRLLHYSLNPSGYLMLGSSESIGDAPDLFSLIDRKNKVYAKKNVPSQATLDPSFGVATSPGTQPPSNTRPPINLQGVVDRKVLDLYGPPGVVINQDLEVLQFRGHVGPYLDPAPGAATFNLLKIARLELRVELKRLIQQALSQHHRIAAESVFQQDGQTSAVKLDVVPIEDPDTKVRCLAIFFQNVLPPKEVVVLPAVDGHTDEALGALSMRIQDLERELALNKEYLQTTLEDKESSNEELKSAIEELQSANEELQSTNEELETSKEEMQSSNEELTTVNEELQVRMTELAVSNDDLHNVLSGVDRPVVIVGMDRRIRRFTNAAEKLFNLVPGDVGRSVGFLDAFVGTSLEPKVSTCVESLSTAEEEIFASNKHWYSLRISPYKTLDHAIRGALISFSDIDVLKRANDLTRDVAAYAARALAAISQPLLIIDRKLRIVWANETFLRIFQLSGDETIGSLLATIDMRRWDDPGLHRQLELAFNSHQPLRDYEMTSSHDGHRAIKVGASQLSASSETPLLLLSIEPVLP